MALSKPINKELLIYGLSPLHLWIRVLEILLRLGYKMDIRKWRVSQNSIEYKKVEDRKKSIQN
jgi:hypothetical protein